MAQVITNGTVGYRTKLLSEGRARRFAACLQANSRFQQVEVQESGRTKNWYQRHFVTYVPTSEARREALAQTHQDARTARAETEGQDYLFVADVDSIQPFCWCFNPLSGETYETTVFDCSCPDFRYRLKGSGVQCKHMVALSQAAERLEAWPTPIPDPNGPSRVEIRRRMEQDFPNF